MYLQSDCSYSPPSPNTLTPHAPPHSLGTQKDPDTAGASSSPSPSPSTSLTSPAAKEKLSSREEGVREGRKQSEQERMREERRRTGEETRRSQEPEFKGGVRTITSDKEFERELTQAGKTLVVVDFTSDRWVGQ